MKPIYDILEGLLDIDDIDTGLGKLAQSYADRTQGIKTDTYENPRKSSQC